MKRLILVFGLVSSLIIGAFALAGEIVTIPKYIVLTNPTTNQIDKISVEFRYGPPVYAVLKYRPIDSAGRLGRVLRVNVINISDNPETDPLNCIDVSDPWPGCTGVGTGGAFLNPDGEIPWDETSLAFSDFVSGYGSTLKSRADLLIYENVQDVFETQDNP